MYVSRQLQLEIGREGGNCDLMRSHTALVSPSHLYTPPWRLSTRSLWIVKVAHKVCVEHKSFFNLLQLNPSLSLFSTS